MVTFRKLPLAVLSSLAVFLATGCAKDRHDDIPKSAQLVADDTGNVDFSSPDDGMVYVYDRSTGDLLYSGRINNGEHLRVVPKDDRITLNGRTVSDKRIRDNDNVRVFFQPEPRADVAGWHSHRAEYNSRPDSEIIVQPRSATTTDADTVRVRTGNSADSKVTVEPGTDGSKVTIERDAK